MTQDGRIIAAISGRERPRNFHSQVIWTLGVAIVSGQYREGATLPGDAEMMRIFGVSRTVLREALKTLSAKGLIEARAKIGTRVRHKDQWNLFDPDVLAWHFEAGPDIDFLASLAEVRMAIEPEAAAHAAQRRSEQQAAVLLERVEMMAASDTSESFAKHDLEFHRAVADASGNPFVRSISALVELALTAAFTISSPVEDGSAFTRTVQIHREIAEGIRDADPEKARSSMRAAIKEGYDRAAGKFVAEDR
jgi:DNA-binding FadR family transcriptional regulator